MNFNFNVYVIRKTNNDGLNDSAPCHDCYCKMREIGVKYIIFSNKDGSLTKIKARDFTPSRISLGRQFIQGGFIPIRHDKYDDNNSVTSNTSHTSHTSNSDISDICSISSDDTNDSQQTQTSYSTKSKQKKKQKKRKKHK